MFTKKQLSLLDDSIFQTIRITDDFIELRSRSTCHCWIIKKEPPSLNLRYPFTLYHKHKPSDFYHKHGQSYSVEKCIESIHNHDAYVTRIGQK